MKKTRKPAVPKKTAHKLRRAATPAVSVKQGTTAKTRAVFPGAAALADVQLAALAPVTVTGKIKLETSSMTYAQLEAQLNRAAVGMNNTPVYATLPVTADVDAASNALRQQLAELADLERGLKEFRLSLEPWAVTYAAVLNRAAVACENADSTPATLVSGGWDLRRPAGPPQEMPAPAGLGILQSNIAGESTSRWSRVANARYYELMVAPVAGAALTIAEPVTITSTRTRCPLPVVPPGSQLTICVRAVGSRGTGPFCDPLTVRVN